MRKHLLLVGNSPLLFFLARELDPTLANFVHFKVTWLTTEKNLPDLSGWFTSPQVTIKKHLQYVKVVRSELKSISLRDQRVITTKGDIDYDYIVIDQTPYYREEELKAILSNIDEVAMAITAGINQGKKLLTHVKVGGQGAESLQLAAVLKSRISQHHPKSRRHIDFQADLGVASPAIKEFLNNQELGSVARKAATVLRIAPPQPMIANSKVKGLKIDHSGRAMVEDGVFPVGYRNAFIINDVSGEWQNLWRHQKQQATKLARGITDYFNNKKAMILPERTKAYRLVTGDGVAIEIGDLFSARFRARLIHSLEKNFRQRFFSP